MSDLDFDTQEDEAAFGGLDGSPGEPAPAPPRGSGATAGVVKVKGREYAVGLFWSAIEEIPNAAAEAKAAAAREGTLSEFYCIRLSGNPQFGLGKRAEGHRAGMPSLAAAVADNRTGSWVGCFVIGDGYYVVAVKDDGIFPGTDRYYLSEEDARAEFERIYAMDEWGDGGVFAPPTFGFPEAKEMPINNLLIGKPSIRLYDVSGSSRRYALAAGLVLAALAVFGGFRYSAYLAEQANEAALRAMRAAGQRGLKQKVEIPPMPWEGRVQGVPFMEACVEAVVRLRGIEFPGWKSVNYDCTGGAASGGKAVVIELVRDGPVNSINWVKYEIEKQGLRASASPRGGQGAAVTQTMGPLPAIPIEVQTAKIPDMQRFLISQFDERLTRIDLTSGEHNQFVTGLRLGFKTQVSPTSFTDILSRIPALVITKMNYDPKSWLWTIEGVTYEQHIPANVTRAGR